MFSNVLIILGHMAGVDKNSGSRDYMKNCKTPIKSIKISDLYLFPIIMYYCIISR